MVVANNDGSKLILIYLNFTLLGGVISKQQHEKTLGYLTDSAIQRKITEAIKEHFDIS